VETIKEYGPLGKGMVGGVEEVHSTVPGYFKKNKGFTTPDYLKKQVFFK
jgi:hypothetical protein